jgi:hypothetical protein
VIADIEAYRGPLATFSILIQTVALTVATRSGAFASWLAPISAALAIEQLAETATVLGDHGFFAPGGDMNTLLAPAIYAIWIIAQGIAATYLTGPRHVPRECVREGQFPDVTGAPAPVSKRASRSTPTRLSLGTMNMSHARARVASQRRCK